MQRQRFAGVRRSGIALVATALVVLGQAAQASQRATVSASDPGQLSQAVTLITGERVLVGTSPGGIPTARILPAAGSGPAMPLNTVHMGGDTYVIPASAEPYMSRYLDPNLFDVTRLSDAGITGRVPLRLTFTPGTTPSIPGVTITTSSSGVASGYVTAASAPRFGAALAAQAYADQQAGWPVSSSLFGSITAISADVAPPPPVTVPNFPMVTLIIHAISHAGGDIPFGFGFLMNQDDGAKYTGFVFLVNGEARVSVPVGTYLGLMDEWVFSANNGVTTRVMVASGYAVSAGGQTLTFDARQATAAPSVSTPKPSAAQELDLTFDASDAVGHSFVSWGYGFGFPGSRVFLTPAASPAVGTLSETTRWIRVDPSIPGGSYTYDATFQDPGVPADQSHTIPGPARSAAIDATYHADRLGQTGATIRLVFIPGAFFAFASGIDLTMPTHRTEYVVAPAGSVAEDDVLANVNSWFDPGWFQGGIESVDPGIVRAETWLRDPFSMGVPAPTASSDGFACLACRSTGRMTFVMYPQDGDPTHSGLPFGSPNGSPVAHFTVYLDGTQLLSKTDRLGAIFSVPTTTGTYRVVSQLNRRLTQSVLSTTLRTDVTFQSAAGSGAPLPSNWYCFTAQVCNILPVLTANIDLHATAIGTLPLGGSTFDLTVGHIAGADDPAITKVNVAVRRSGVTGPWTYLPVSAGSPGQYQVAFSASAGMSGHAMDLQITATDDQGGILHQTTTQAFSVAP